MHSLGWLLCQTQLLSAAQQGSASCLKRAHLCMRFFILGSSVKRACARALLRRART
jgi:hypothetical protein